jgi:hypothetical protein
MTVKELIKHLKGFEENLEVAVVDHCAYPLVLDTNNFELCDWLPSSNFLRIDMPDIGDNPEDY